MRVAKRPIPAISGTCKTLQTEDHARCGTALTMAAEHFDVLIVGAGLSGIGAGYHLQHEAPNKSYAILEGRD